MFIEHPHDILSADGTDPLTGPWDVGPFDIRAQNLTADALTAARVVFTGANGLLSEEAAFAYNSGTDQLTVGTINLPGGQIAFPASPDPSTDANTLDDYEEGTWTPVLGGSGGTSGQTYGLQVGYYTKIGRQVFCSMEIQLTAKGTITTNLEIHGLPFACANLDGAEPGINIGFPYKWTLTNTAHEIYAHVKKGQSVIRLFEFELSGDMHTYLDTNAIGNDSSIRCSFTYTV